MTIKIVHDIRPFLHSRAHTHTSTRRSEKEEADDPQQDVDTDDHGKRKDSVEERLSPPGGLWNEGAAAHDQCWKPLCAHVEFGRQLGCLDGHAKGRVELGRHGRGQVRLKGKRTRAQDPAHRLETIVGRHNVCLVGRDARHDRLEAPRVFAEEALRVVEHVHHLPRVPLLLLRACSRGTVTAAAAEKRESAPAHCVVRQDNDCAAVTLLLAFCGGYMEPDSPPAARITLDPPSAVLSERHERVTTQSSFEAGLWKALATAQDRLRSLLSEQRSFTHTNEAAWSAEQIPHTRLRLAALVERCGDELRAIETMLARLEVEQAELRTNADDLLLAALSSFMSWPAPTAELFATTRPPIDLSNPALGAAANNVQDTAPLAERIHISPF